MAARKRAHSRRDAEPEAREAALRIDPDRAAAELDELLHDCETDAGATARAITRLLDAVEALEDMRQISGWDLLAGVGDADEGAVARGLSGDRHPTAFRRVADRVLQQVREDLREVIRVRARPHVSRHVHGDGDAAAIELRQGEVDGHLDGLPEIDLDELRLAIAIAHRERIERARQAR